MPHAVFDTGAINATGDNLPRILVPGIEPGGSRAGQPTKPVIMIRDIFTEIVTLSSDASADTSRAMVYLKLSQEPDLNPGLVLPVLNVITGHSATANESVALDIKDFGGKWAGSLWAAAYVGLRYEEVGGSWATMRFLTHLEYEVVDVPWMQWFIMWDFLDNVVDNQRQF